MTDDQPDETPPAVPDGAGGERGARATATTRQGVDTGTTTGPEARSKAPGTLDGTDRRIPPAEGRFPRSLARAVLTATLVGALALSVHQPSMGAGVLVGVVSALAASKVGRGLFTITAAAMGMPVVVVGLVAAFGAATQTTQGQAVLVVGLVAGFVATTVGPTTTDHDLQQFGLLAVLAGVAVGAPAGLVALADNAGGFGPLADDVAGIFAGLWGLLNLFVLAVFALVLAVYTVPAGLLVSPERRERASLLKRRVSVVLAAAGGLSFLLALGIPGAGTGDLVRRLLVLCTFVCGMFVCTNLVVKLSWTQVGDVSRPMFGWMSAEGWQTRDPETNPVVGVLAGLQLSAWAALALVVGVTGVSGSVVALFALTTAALMLGGALLVGYAASPFSTPLVGPASVVAFALGSGAVASLPGAGDGTTLALDLAGLATLVAVGAALFVYSAGKHGRTLASEVGASGTARQPQLVWLGWHTVVIGLGVLASVGLFWFSRWISLSLSTPARAGLGIGFVALVALILLLLRD